MPLENTQLLPPLKKAGWNIWLIIMVYHVQYVIYLMAWCNLLYTVPVKNLSVAENVFVFMFIFNTMSTTILHWQTKRLELLWLALTVLFNLLIQVLLLSSSTIHSFGRRFQCKRDSVQNWSCQPEYCNCWGIFWICASLQDNACWC